MDAYNYDPATGEFLNALPMRESPLEPGVWLVPAHATNTAPPEAVPGHAVCWRDGAWEQVPDFRGHVRWDAVGQRVEITALGSLPEGLTDVESVRPPVPPVPPAAEPLDLNSISIGHAERLYELAQIEATAPLNGADGKPLPGPATVLLEILGL